MTTDVNAGVVSHGDGHIFEQRRSTILIFFFYLLLLHRCLSYPGGLLAFVVVDMVHLRSLIVHSHCTACPILVILTNRC